MKTTPDLDYSLPKEIRKNRVLSFLENGPQSHKELEAKYGRGPSSITRLLIELEEDKKISRTIHNKKPAYEITKKGKNSLLSFGIIGMLINKILGLGGLYQEDYSNLRGSMYYNQLPWGIQDDLVYDKKLEKYNPITKETASKIQKLLYNSIKEDVKNRKIKLDESKDGLVILGFIIDYKDLVKSIKENSMEYVEMMTEKEQDILAKYEDDSLTDNDISEHKRLRNLTNVKVRKRT